MNNNLLAKYKENFFSKIIMKIRKLFFRSKNKSEKVKNINTVNLEKNNNEEENILNELKVDIEFDYKNYANEVERKDFMDNLTKKPDLLENFSTERLKKILQWYVEENEKKRVILKKLNS